MFNFTLKRASVVGLVLAFGIGASAQTFLYEGICYKASGNKLTVQSVTGKTKPTPENGTLPEHYTGDIVLPETIVYNGKTYTVDKLGTGFKGEPITSLHMPNSVTDVGIGAFQDCSSLTTINLSTGLTKLKQNMFTNCTALTEITIPGTISALPNATFKACTGLTKITFESSETPIEAAANAFVDGGNSALKEVVIHRPINVEKVAAMADKPFRGITSIETVVLDGGVTEIPASYFEGCSSLKNVTLGENVATIGTNVFAGTAVETVTLPEAVTSVSSGLFASTPALNTVVLGSGVTSIDALAFSNSAIRNINLPEGLKTIGDQAFSGSGLAGELVLPSTVTRIGAQAFAKSTGLTSVSIPAATAAIGDGVFMGCSAMTNFTVAADNENYKSVEGKYIQSADGKRLLCYAPALADEAFTGAFEEIAPYAFFGAKNLKTITLDACRNFGDYSMNGTGLTKATVRGTVGRYVLAENPALTEVTVECPEIPFGLAANDAALTTANLPAQITVVKQDAFKNCSALKSLKLGNILAILEADCFAGAGIEALEVASTFPAAMAQGVFTEGSNITATVPADLVAAYKAADGWSYLNIVGDANLAAGGADMGMPDGLYFAGDDNMLHCAYADNQFDTYDVGEIPHTFQLLEYSNRIYGACAGKKFVYSATGATDGDGKLFYISKVGGKIFQAVVLDNTGNNAYKDPFGLYLYGEDLYVNDRNVCIRVIPASAIALPQNYPSWMENNWMAFYGAPWSYGCIKCGFAITKTTNNAGQEEPLYWVGMKYNGNGLFRFRAGDIGTAEQAGPKPAEEAMLTTLGPIYTTFNLDVAHNHLYLYLEKCGDPDYRAGLYRVNISDIEANPNPAKFSELNPVLIDGSPVKYEGSAANEHVGISQLAIVGDYMYWCYRAPADAAEAALTEEQSATDESKGRYYWADKYDENNPLHHSGIKRIKLGEAQPTVEMVVPGVSGYGIAVVNFEGSTKPNSGTETITVPSLNVVSYADGVVTATADVTVSVYNTAGVLVASAELTAGQTLSLEDLAAGVYVIAANGTSGAQTLKVVK